MISHNKRPTLADMGSLMGPSSVSVKPSARPVAAPLHTSAMEKHASQLEESSVGLLTLDQDIPLEDQDADSCPSEAPSMVAPFANLPITEAHSQNSSIQMTQMDKIEVALEKIDPAVRAFIEDEFRARFVSVISA
jgi:hypothetical protein